MTFDDFKAELNDRGFSGFDDSQLGRYINWGGRFVANRTRPHWEQFHWDVTLNPGDFAITLASMTGIKSIDVVMGTSAGALRKLGVEDDERFLAQWLPMDLTAVGSRGEPNLYQQWQDKIYFLPPPSAVRTFTVYGRRRWVDLANGGDTPVTPDQLDEAVLLASLIRCHRRSNEPDLAMQARADLEEQFDIVADEDEMLLAEEADRVERDDTWL